MKKQTMKQFGYCLFISFLFLTICSKSSFLYNTNPWMDANCFLTIGKGALHNQLFYVDLFDQKGPLLYLYHTIAAIISPTSFLGVYIIEIISFSLFLFFAFQLLQLYLKKETCYFCIPIISFLILTLPAFSHGDSAEEFCLPFLMYSFYSLIKFLKTDQKIPSRQFILLNGICAGCVLTIKFSMLGFWIGFIISISILLILQKSWKQLFFMLLIFGIGMLIPFSPWIIYFGIHNALNDFLFSYFYFNIHYYPSQISLIIKILMPISKPIRFFARNLGIGIPFFIGILTLVFDHRILNSKRKKLILLSSIFFLIFFIFTGGVSFRYYYLILTPFSILGLIAIGIWIEQSYPNLWNKNWDAILMIFTTIIIMFTFYGSLNTNEMKIFKNANSTAQVQFAKIINNTKNASILNYGFLDGGFYLASNTLPTTKYFQHQNIDDQVFPDIRESQNKIIINQQVDFIITRNLVTKKIKNENLIQNYYEPVKTVKQQYEEHEYKYTLWQKRKEIKI